MERYYPVEITTNVGQVITSPLTTVVPLENGLLVDIEIQIPAGHVGLTGVRVRFSQQQVLPFGNNSWIKADDYNHTFEMNTEVGVRTVSVQTYNNDIYNHTHYLRFRMRDINSAPSVGSPGGPIVIAESIDEGLSGAVDLTTGQPIPPPLPGAPPVPVLPPPPVLTP